MVVMMVVMRAVAAVIIVVFPVMPFSGSISVIIVMSVVRVIIPVMIPVVLKVGAVLDGVDPGGRSRDLVEIEEAGVQYAVEIHVAIVALDDARRRLESPDYAPDPAQILRRDFRSLVQHHYVAELYLLDYQVLDVLVGDVVLLQLLTAVELTLHPEGVDHRDYAVKVRQTVHHILRTYLRYRTYGLGDRCRFAYAAGLYDYIVEAAAMGKVAQLGNQVHLQGAAYATVLQSDETLVSLSHDSAFLNQVSIYVDFAYIIDNDGETYAFPVGEYPVDERGLAAAEITGQQQDRNPVFCHGCRELLQALEAGLDIGFYGLGAVVTLDESFAGDVLVELDVPVGDAGNDFRSHLRHLLSVLALETVGHKPLPHELLGELLLLLALCEPLAVALGIEIP